MRVVVGDDRSQMHGNPAPRLLQGKIVGLPRGGKRAHGKCGRLSSRRGVESNPSHPQGQNERTPPPVIHSRRSHLTRHSGDPGPRNLFLGKGRRLITGQPKKFLWQFYPGGEGLKRERQPRVSAALGKGSNKYRITRRVTKEHNSVCRTKTCKTSCAALSLLLRATMRHRQQ